MQQLRVFTLKIFFPLFYYWNGFRIIIAAHSRMGDEGVMG